MIYRAKESSLDLLRLLLNLVPFQVSLQTQQYLLVHSQKAQPMQHNWLSWLAVVPPRTKQYLRQQLMMSVLPAMYLHTCTREPMASMEEFL
jgi:hypothetical protein